MTAPEAGILDQVAAVVAAAYTEQRDEIGDSDLHGEQPIRLLVTLPLGVIRRLRIRTWRNDRANRRDPLAALAALYGTPPMAAEHQATTQAEEVELDLHDPDCRCQECEHQAACDQDAHDALCIARGSL